MIGGYFDDIPGNVNAPILWKTRVFPGCKWPARSYSATKIYQIRNYSRDKVRVLMRLDATNSISPPEGASHGR